MFWFVEDRTRVVINNIIATLLIFVSSLFILQTSCYLILFAIKGLRKLYYKLKPVVEDDKKSQNSGSTNDTVEIDVISPETTYFSLIFLASLEKEEERILGTILKALTDISYPSNSYEVILAYNSESNLPRLESQLIKLSTEKENFSCVKVQNSSNKAANLNFVLENVIDYKKTDVIGIFSADQHLDPYILGVASLDFAECDILQGLCNIRNTNSTFISRISSAEVNFVEGVSNHGRYVSTKVGYFTGNGFWKASLLKQIQMDVSMISPDIDASLRAITYSNAKFKYNSHVVSSKLAPTTVSEYLAQRIKQARGWFQIFLIHCGDFRYIKGIVKKFSLIEMLLLRELFFCLSLVVFANALSNILVHLAKKTESDIELRISTTFDTVYQYFVIVALSLSALSLICEGSRTKNLLNCLLLIVVSPILLPINIFIALTGHLFQLLDHDAWVSSSKR